MNTLIEWISESNSIKMILGALFFVLISYLAFCNGENIGRFIYTIFH